MLKICIGFLIATLLLLVSSCSQRKPYTPYREMPPSPLQQQDMQTAASRSTGCLSCHTGAIDPHDSVAVNLSCVDCHGGNGTSLIKEEAHPKPLHPERWTSAANPKQSYTLLNKESNEWIRFVNPGDLRVANQNCGSCHGSAVLAVSKSLMTTSAHFWGAASYSNGITSNKMTIFGESYSPEGIDQKVYTVPPPSEDELARSVIPFVLPLPKFEISQTGNIYRVFEQGSRLPNSLIGLPDKLEDPGRPNNRLSDRGLGTLNRVDLPLLNVHKTRLNDPHLSFFGTNDNPGDYRSSGCTACHVVYANDRSPVHSGPYAKFGNSGFTQNPDPTIFKKEEGHPIEHKFTRSIPSSQCMVCHMHQPNSFLNTYYGYQMWSYETDGELMWPKEQQYPTHEQLAEKLARNPEEAATRGLWGDPEFLKNVSDLNPKLKHTQFADYHGHGWIFRGVYKMDRKGNLLDKDGQVIPYDDPEKFNGAAVHLKDIHAEKGMHCIDCHFTQDSHGDGKLYGEYQAAISISCKDCHGNATARANLMTSGPAAASGSMNLSELSKTPFKKPRFEVKDGKIIQNSMLEKDLSWEVSQVLDSVTEGNPEYNAKAARAKLCKSSDGKTLAHGDGKMECYSCHTSWVTSCFGCHLPQKANWKTEEHHFEGNALRNFASYNPQVARDDAFMLAIAGNVKSNKISTARSSSAVLISSEDAQRQKIYTQLPTMAANGMSSQAFNTHFAHTVRKTETRACEDCHVSEKNDNNAWLAQTYLLGTNFVNFMGYHAYVGCADNGFHAVRVTEWDEPQAVIGSNLHRLAYPDDYKKHEENARELRDSEKHSGNILNLQLRGEYLYSACGPEGVWVYDVANASNKGFSEKIITAPVSPLGQGIHIKTEDARAIALTTNNPTSMSRVYRPENKETPYEYKGKTQNLHESYRYAYVADFKEGLVLIDVDCLTDGEPRNNFIRKVLSFNPKGALDGAVNLAVAGTTVYVCSTRGVFAISIEDPLNPKIIASVEAPAIQNPKAIAIQFRYAFIVDEDGLKTLEITSPESMRLVPDAKAPIRGALDLYVARTYAYVSAGKQGLAIVDIEQAEKPRVDQWWNANGAIDDLHQVKVAMTNDSLFAYLADGKNGLRIAQLITPEDGGRSAYGFSPRPKPKLISTFSEAIPAIAISKGLDRDRAVDESGHQMSVFGRIGGRPMNLQEMHRLYLRDGKLFKVSND